MNFSRRDIFPLIAAVSFFFIFSGCSGDAAGREETAAVPAEEVEESTGEDGMEDPDLEEDAESSGQGSPDIIPDIDGNISEGEYAASLEEESTGIEFFWSHDGQELFAGIKTGSPGWVAAGFDPASAMKEANMIFLVIDDGEVVVRDDFGTSTFSHSPDLDLGGTDDISAYAASSSDGITTYEFSIPLDSGDEYDRVLVPGDEYTVIFAVNDNGTDFDSKHSARGSAVMTLGQ